jgi:hypothetical protein
MPMGSSRPALTRTTSPPHCSPPSKGDFYSPRYNGVRVPSKLRSIPSSPLPSRLEPLLSQTPSTARDPRAQAARLASSSQHDSRPNRPVLRHGGRDDFASVKPQRGVAVGRHMAAQSHRLVFCGNVEVLQIGSVRTSDPRRTSTPTPPPTRPPALHPQLRRAT